MSEQGSTLNPSVVNAAAPFDDPKADVILRSSDNVDFRCHKLLLSMASTFFEGMFSLPQPNGADGDEKKDGLHVVPMEERAPTLEAILKLCHPSSIRNPPILELDAIRSIFGAARKYGMEDAEHLVRSALISARFLDDEPLRVFGIACALRLAAEARIAAAATLELDVEGLDYFPELEYISGADLFHLQKYHKNCRRVAHDIASDFKWLVGGEYIWFTCGIAHRDIDSVGLPGHDRPTSNWWVNDYVVPCREALEKKPVGKTVKTDELMARAIRSGRHCQMCSPENFVDLKAFGKVFGQEIDKAVAEEIIGLSWDEQVRRE
ncbi:hypothetical protein FIBSPDRAFT_857168 [Athelia psychrophila]|uniref:BTB domain-containing protein n=1 Tax=Athelia psychrophila TaxID=1759441 RepID=A0A166MZ36_9AGAM|nr:hypothetical protein FIBSPDRAFT_857168 [Fibularhizoctonia sp. CBS 109695]